MAKTFMGLRLRRLRAERGITQASLARSLGISASYLNQIENNQRPLTVPVLLKLNAAFGLDVQLFSDADEPRLIVELRGALADQGAAVSLAELRDLAANMPEVARTIVAMQARLRDLSERADALAGRLSTPAPATPPASFEAVRDWFYDRRNHVPELDGAAEAVAADLPVGRMAPALGARLQRAHGIRLAHTTDGALRRFEAAAGVLYLGAHLSPGQQAFQIATQLAFLEQGAVLGDLCAASGLDPEAQRLLRVGLANYYAGALLMPYGAFLEAAESLAYDIDLLARRFGVGFETTCHRLSTLQRPEARGVPFFFIRVDRAGNISKRQSATDFHFSRIGGSCPLWNIYAAFSRPGEVLRQVAQMPDGRSYLWIARQLRQGGGGFGAPEKRFAVALGCDLAHAERLVYARGLNLKAPDLATRIGPGCKLCDRPDCPQRAFPMLGKPLALRPEEARFAPYSGTP